MRIKLNDKIGIDLDELIVSRMLIQANSGGGKSWAIRRIIEQAFGKVQIIVIDPEGEFNNLRQNHDFVYVAKDGDAPATVQSAALLARRLMETKASAIIDLYEIPNDRKLFVKNFLDSLVNLPKELWHDCLIIIDEAHKFAPEKEESLALESVSNLASLGRKRGYCLIAASGRPAKLNKDVAAECNNKLIGRATLDVDRKRNADEIGLTNKTEVLELRNLEPGNFYAFGPAISRDVQIIQVGDIAIKPAKRGASKKRPPAPSASVKKILAKLKDLPQEAQKEAQSMKVLHDELRTAKSELAKLQREKKTVPVVDKDAIERAIKVAIERERKGFAAFKNALFTKLVRAHGNFNKVVEDVLHELRKEATKGVIETVFLPVKPTKDDKPLKLARHDEGFAARTAPREASDGSMGEGEKKVLTALAQYDGISREHITALTGYKRSTRDKYLYLLVTKGYAQELEGLFASTDVGKDLLGPVDPLPEGRELAEHYIKTLPAGEAKVLQFLLDQEVAVSREQITDATGFQRSTRDKYVYLLRVRQLVNMRGNLIKISDHLL